MFLFSRCWKTLDCLWYEGIKFIGLYIPWKGEVFSSVSIDDSKNDSRHKQDGSGRALWCLHKWKARPRKRDLFELSRPQRPQSTSQDIINKMGVKELCNACKSGRLDEVKTELRRGTNPKELYQCVVGQWFTRLQTMVSHCLIVRYLIELCGMDEMRSTMQLAMDTRPWWEVRSGPDQAHLYVWTDGGACCWMQAIQNNNQSSELLSLELAQTQRGTVSSDY